jgi:DUF3047 family protein
MFSFGARKLSNSSVSLLSKVLLGLLIVTGPAHAALIEDWTRDPLSRKGIPSGWTGEAFGGRASFDFMIEQDAGKRFLHLASHNEHSTIAKDITGKVNLQETPILEWIWKATVLPTGGDIRRRETTDMAAQIYVVWPRFPRLLRSRIIGYVWDTTAPVATIAKSQKTSTVTFVVMRSGPEELGKWIMERRNVVEDYAKIFGEAPDDPGVITISIDSNDTRSAAEFSLGSIAFRSR